MTPEQRINLAKMAEASTFEGAEWQLIEKGGWERCSEYVPLLDMPIAGYRVRVPRPEVVTPYEDASVLDGAVVRSIGTSEIYEVKQITSIYVKLSGGGKSSLTYLCDCYEQYHAPHDWRPCGVVTGGGWDVYSIEGVQHDA